MSMSWMLPGGSGSQLASAMQLRPFQFASLEQGPFWTDVPCRLNAGPFGFAPGVAATCWISAMVLAGPPADHTVVLRVYGPEPLMMSTGSPRTELHRIPSGVAL